MKVLDIATNLDSGWWRQTARAAKEPFAANQSGSYLNFINNGIDNNISGGHELFLAA